MTSTDSNKAIVSRFFDALNSGDVDTLVGTYADDGTVTTMGNTLISGTFTKQQIGDASRRALDVFPSGLQFTIKDMIAEGDKVAVEAESEGEHVSGKTYINEYHFLFEFRDGQLLHLREYMDTETVTDVLCGGQRPPFDS